MKTRTEYAAEAERLASRAHHFTYGDGGDPVTGAALATEAQVFATLATVAPTGPQPVPAPQPYIPVALSIRLRELHQNHGGECGICADETGSAARWPCDTFTALDDAERQLPPYEDEPTIDDVMSASERYELDQDAEFAHDAAADEANTADVEAEEADHR